ncbi:hypothetical protein K435DRAFT_903181 [Dendrothele bispora CBS 962.96]|uniref:Uncharacterized protein n=1 Tax=Dendrothele bispora (strain CBS 962.96) TaxID=1314807 RepID=A0A4S8MNV9_DENBC|nr:hypothetical protein K435DRAFT_903181 [Dendrothele bispora CBS 962.96]
MPSVEIMSRAEHTNWLATTDTEMTYIGKTLAERTPLDTTVTYCSDAQGPVCGGACTTYVGGPKCLAAPNTNCVRADRNVAFCANDGCSDCNFFNDCGTRMDNNFCFTPHTKSILVEA